MRKFAVVDGGTNTFHLLIATPAKQGGVKEIYRERIYVKLADEGIQTIGQNAFDRAVNTLVHYAEIINKHQVSNIRISGTAALRTASNGPTLVQEIEEKTGLKIDIISGDDEAQLIYKGVALAIGPQDERWMVMDLGGGSVEFIIVDKSGVLWFESFPVGVAVTYKHFHQNEPIQDLEIEHLHTFLAGQLANLQLALLRYPVHHLVGAAGTFDVVASVLGAIRPTNHSAEVELGGFNQLYNRLISATDKERLAMPDIPDDRADMIVVAIILVKYILELANVNQLTVSDYSMKEGMLVEMMGE